MLCGVPVSGSPWAFSAAIYDRGDHSFQPTEVEILPGKAYIRGWYFISHNTICIEDFILDDSYDDGFVPAEIVCDLSNGEVIHAALFVGEDIKE